MMLVRRKLLSCQPLLKRMASTRALVAVLQMNCNEDKENNFKTGKRLVQEAAARGAKVLGRCSDVMNT